MCRSGGTSALAKAAIAECTGGGWFVSCALSVSMSNLHKSTPYIKKWHFSVRMRKKPQMDVKLCSVHLLFFRDSKTVDGLSHCSPIWIKQPSPQVQGDLNSEQQTQGRASELPLNPQDKGLESWSDWLTWMFGIMFYSEGIDLDSLFSLLTSFDIPETLHLVAPGDHDFAPHWGRLGQYTEISNGLDSDVLCFLWDGLNKETGN